LRDGEAELHLERHGETLHISKILIQTPTLKILETSFPTRGHLEVERVETAFPIVKVFKRRIMDGIAKYFPAKMY